MSLNYRRKSIKVDGDIYKIVHLAGFVCLTACRAGGAPKDSSFSRNSCNWLIALTYRSKSHSKVWNDLFNPTGYFFVDSQVGGILKLGT